MPNLDLELNPTLTIKLDAIGKPGERIFYIQGSGERQTVTLLIEKYQVQMLAPGTEQFLMEIKERFPELPDASPEYEEADMQITPPPDPLFQVAEMSMGYDIEHDMVVLILREAEVPANPEDKPSVVRLWCTRSQILGLAAWAQELAGRGRPTWLSSGEPILPKEQFSPRNNGHKH
ncbi:MAG: DUF3090 family protein [Anaerolineaceae bacterium]